MARVSSLGPPFSFPTCLYYLNAAAQPDPMHLSAPRYPTWCVFPLHTLIPLFSYTEVHLASLEASLRRLEIAFICSPTRRPKDTVSSKGSSGRGRGIVGLLVLGFSRETSDAGVYIIFILAHCSILGPLSPAVVSVLLFSETHGPSPLPVPR